MTDVTALRALADSIADAIGKRDVDALARVLAPEFVHRGDAGAESDGAAFLEGIRGIPGEIVFVRLERVDVAIEGDAAMLTGIQRAQVRIDGAVIDDRRAFADFFVKLDGTWKLRGAADFPAS